MSVLFKQKMYISKRFLHKKVEEKYFLCLSIVLSDYAEVHSKSGVGNIGPAGRFRPAKQNHPAHSLFTKCSTCMVRLVVLCFINLPSLQLHVLQYLSRSTCEKPHCAINVLCHFLGFRYEL